MAERMTALAGRRPVTDNNAGILIEELLLATILQIDLWSDRDAAPFIKAVKQGLDVPAVRRVVALDQQHLARLTPERFLLISKTGAELSLPADHGSVFDLGHARCCLRISGAQVEQVLAKGAVLDFSDEGFPVGTVAQTVAHHMDLTIIRRSETEFDILAFRGFAESLLEHLMDAAGEFGVSFRPVVPPT